jgi:hypothetical protein
MVTYRESSADRLWREKVESRASPGEAFVLLIVVLALVAGSFFS